MKETLILAGGFYTVALIVFHLLFWRIFDWPQSLQATGWVNRSTIQVLNISITFIFFIFAYISFLHRDDLLNTGLGHALLVLISVLWLFRALQQIVFYGLKHWVSWGLMLYFMLGSGLYGMAAF